jgi:hypothetical protein
MVASKKVKVRGRRLAPLKVWATDFRKQDADVAYLSTALVDRLSGLTDHARKRGILTVTGVRRYMHAGAALAVVPKAGGGHEILINLKEAKAQGSNFDTRLLLVARAVNPQ